MVFELNIVNELWPLLALPIVGIWGQIAKIAAPFVGDILGGILGKGNKRQAGVEEFGALQRDAFTDT
ncbi:MAG: hypothetical protein J3T61_03180, partial [Candidatus Brocadiales bacterium]|nr:hypothetical protein [Candidatus Bathyanammoxibius sp.]